MLKRNHQRRVSNYFLVVVERFLTFSPGDLVEAVNAQVDHLGFNIFSSELTKDELASACKVLKIKFGDDEKEIKNPSKVKYTTVCSTYIFEGSLEKETR